MFMEPVKDRTQYREIVALYAYCEELGIPASLKEFLDGYAIRFANGSDFVQHFGSYGAKAGYVEPAIGCELDYTAVALDQAKALVEQHKDRLTKAAVKE